MPFALTHVALKLLGIHILNEPQNPEMIPLNPP